MIQIDTNSAEIGQTAPQALPKVSTDESGDQPVDFSQVWSEFAEPDARKEAGPHYERSPIAANEDAPLIEDSPETEAPDVHPTETMPTEQHGARSFASTQILKNGVSLRTVNPDAVQTLHLAEQHDRPTSGTGLGILAPPNTKLDDPNARFATSEQAPVVLTASPQPETLPNRLAIAFPANSAAPIAGNVDRQLQPQVFNERASSHAVLRGQDSELRQPLEGVHSRIEQNSAMSTKLPSQTPPPTSTTVPAQFLTQRHNTPSTLSRSFNENSRGTQSITNSNSFDLSKKVSSPKPSLLISEPIFLSPLSAPEIEGPTLQPLQTGLANASTSGTPAPTPSAPQIAAQIVAAVSHSSGSTTEILLNPEELGRVRISLTNGDAGMTVNILAERAEAADLMRRNIELLARELRDMGYENPSFTFGERSDDPSDAWGDEPPETAPETSNNTSEQPTSNMRVTLTGGLDLKL